MVVIISMIIAAISTWTSQIKHKRKMKNRVKNNKRKREKRKNIKRYSRYRYHYRSCSQRCHQHLLVLAIPNHKGYRLQCRCRYYGHCCRLRGQWTRKYIQKNLCNKRKKKVIHKKDEREKVNEEEAEEDKWGSHYHNAAIAATINHLLSPIITYKLTIIDYIRSSPSHVLHLLWLHWPRAPSNCNENLNFVEEALYSPSANVHISFSLFSMQTNVCVFACVHVAKRDMDVCRGWR